MSYPVKVPKKLIEVALPLDDINAAAAREKSIRHGHPSTLHLWWARRPLAAARAVLWAQMVNDPGGDRGYGPGKTKAQVERERERLFDILRKLVIWENSNDEVVLSEAREEIWKSWRETCELNKSHPEAEELFNPDKLPAFHDPFAGGGAIPLEAQRLGLESWASDLNPVAVMINKAMIEIPPKFAGKKPSGPIPSGEQKETNHIWSGATGLAEDIRRYGYWVYEQAYEKIGNFYPKVRITSDMIAERPDLKEYENQELTVISWLWARTVKSPNPAFSDIDVPLVHSFSLSKKKGKEYYINAYYDGIKCCYNVQNGKINENSIEATIQRSGGICLASKSVIPFDYIREEGRKGRIKSKLMAIVLEGRNSRVYVSSNEYHEKIANVTIPDDVPITQLPDKALSFRVQAYGMTQHQHLFTPRQLIALTDFSKHIHAARDKAIKDAIAFGMDDDGVSLEQGGNGATAYGDAIAVYLAFGVDKGTDYWSNLCSWHSGREIVRNTFGRQALPMVWDYCETNPFSNSTGNWLKIIDWIWKVIANSNVGNLGKGTSLQKDAQTQEISNNKLISTDPPYYDNIGYADLSDFFYVWLRKAIRPYFPQLCSTMAVPKAEELVATPYRHGNKQNAETFFLLGMTDAMSNLSRLGHPAFPITIYYAFKQSETKSTSTSSTGWETFLQAVITAGFTVVGTWPMRTELSNRMVGAGTNALASSIVLVCQKRDNDSHDITRRDFVTELKDVMPDALDAMIGGTTGSSPIAPVDLAQASIGPGMALYSKYKAVLNQDGSSMNVHDALVLINQAITDHLSPESGSFDEDTAFCSAWFDQYGWASGPFGEADILGRAKGTSVNDVVEDGVIESGAGKVRLYRWDEYPESWDPEKDKRLPVWEALHHLIRIFKTEGETAAGVLLSAMIDHTEAIRQLAYHLYTLCERKKWAEEARVYNELIISWHNIITESAQKAEQTENFELDFNQE